MKVALWLILLAGAAMAQPETPLNERVLVVYNSGVDGSQNVAKYYAEKRQIPKANLCKIDSEQSAIYWADGMQYEPEIKKRVRGCLEKVGKEKIFYIVLAYGVPFGANIAGKLRAIDQLLADVWDEYAAAPLAYGRDVGNQPYFGNAQSQGNAYDAFVPFAKYRRQLGAKTIYSVWHLDAATVELAKGLVDKALYAEAHGLKGKAYFDLTAPPEGQPDTGYPAGNWDILRASKFAAKAGFDVTLDDKGSEFGTAPSALRCENAALFAGWYQLQHYNDVFSWAPGAIGFHSDSASATDLHSNNNWVGGALLRGITVSSGSITEPFLEGLVHPDQVFLALFQGANVGDAVLRGTRWLKWMILNVGDPLYRPFPNGAGPYGSTIYKEPWFAIVPENLAGGGTALGVLSLAEDADKPLTVSVKSTNPELVTLPPPSTIPAAGNGARFPIVTKAPKDLVSVIVTVTAGNQTYTNTLTLLPGRQPPAAVKP